MGHHPLGPLLLAQQASQTAPQPTGAPGLLGPRPAQAYAATVEPSSDLVPTDVEATLHTMTLNPPDDSWYMDTGASSHMTGDSGTLTCYFNPSNVKNILVGNGHTIPVHGYGSTLISEFTPPLSLNHVFIAPQIIKNHIFVRKFTTDDNVSVEFHPFGFHVMDL